MSTHMRWFSRVSIGLALLSLIFIGCAEPPTDGIQAAKIALADAQAAEAERYASNAFEQATAALAKADKAVTEQNKKFALTRDYTQAKQLIEAAHKAAQNAKTTAMTNRERARTETERLLAQIENAIMETKALVASAPKDKALKPALDECNNDLTMTEAALADVKMVESTGDYLKAKSQATTAFASASSTKDELQQAIAKYTESLAAKKRKRA